MASLFTSQTPTGTNNSDGAPGITVGTTVRFAQAGWVTAIRFYATTTVSGTYTGALWQVTSDDTSNAGTGTLLVSKVLGGSPTAGAWNLITLDTPVAVTTGVLYRAGVHSSDGRYVNTGSFFTADVVNGDITADANGDDPVLLGSLRQGTFTINAALSYPQQSFSASSYFADVDFVLTLPGGGAGVEPQVITAPVTVVRPAAAAAALLYRAPVEVAAQPSVAAAQPLVVTAVQAVRRGVALLAREPVPPPPSGPFGPSAEPLVVTARTRPPVGLSVILAAPRSAVCDCTTHRPSLGVTVRPSLGVTVRPSLGVTVRPCGC